MATWRGRWRDAQNFWDVAETSHDPKHGNQAASNAILAIIAANDAVCLYLGQRQPGGESHTAAARVLRKACQGTRWEAEAARRSAQLLEIMRQKNAAQYLGQPLGADAVEKIMKQVDRFMKWAEKILRS